MSQPDYTRPQQPPISPSEERTWGMLSHVVPLAAMVLSAGTLGFVGSLVIYLLYKDRGPFVRRQAANSLNIQIIVSRHIGSIRGNSALNRVRAGDVSSSPAWV